MKGSENQNSTLHFKQLSITVTPLLHCRYCQINKEIMVFHYMYWNIHACSTPHILVSTIFHPANRPLCFGTETGLGLGLWSVA